MNENATVDLVSFDTQITALIPNDHSITNQLPFMRVVKQLIDVSVESEGRYTDTLSELEILEAFLERIQTPKLRISLQLHISTIAGGIRWAHEV